MLMQMGYQQYTSRPPEPAAAAAATQPSTNAFGLPEFDYRLLDFVTKDPSSGQLIMLPGAPPDAVIRVQAFQDQLRQVQQKFFADPMQFLGKVIDERVEKRAAELYQKEFSQHQSQTTAQKLLAENEGWLFQKEGDRFVTQFDPATGREVKVLSPWGKFYQQCLHQVSQSGVTDPAAQHQMAYAMVENAALRAKLQQQAAAPAGDAAAAAFLDRANGAAPTPSPTPAPTPAAAQPAIPMSIKERMRMAFEQNGITDQALAQQLNRNGA